MFDFATAAHEYDIDHPKAAAAMKTTATAESIQTYINRKYPELVATGQVKISTYYWIQNSPTVCVSVVGSLEVIGSTHYYNHGEAGPGLEARINRNLRDWKNN